MCEWGTTKVCETCKYWVNSQTPNLKTCVANTNHIELTGSTFFCKNWENKK